MPFASRVSYSNFESLVILLYFINGHNNDISKFYLLSEMTYIVIPDMSVVDI